MFMVRAETTSLCVCREQKLLVRLWRIFPFIRQLIVFRVRIPKHDRVLVSGLESGVQKKNIGYSIDRYGVPYKWGL